MDFEKAFWLGNLKDSAFLTEKSGKFSGKKAESFKLHALTATIEAVLRWYVISKYFPIAAKYEGGKSWKVGAISVRNLI